MNEQKQIEEMAKELKAVAKIVRTILEDRTDIKYIPDLDFPIAKEVLKHYQPKIPENAVVLTREEFEKFKKQDLFMKDYTIVEVLENETKKARKETAEKFKALLKGTVPQELLDEICKELTEGKNG